VYFYFAVFSSANQTYKIMGNFQHLDVWNEAKVIAVQIYKLTNLGLLSKDFGLRDQMRRSSVSVPSNIAEGEESGSNRKSISYFYISKGSLAELLTQIIIAFEVNYIKENELADLQTRINKLSAKLRKLIQYREKLLLR
jgi:four helix bundle protein